MSLEHVMRRLAIRPSSVCHQCRRTFASSAQQQQPQSATGAFADILQNNRNQDASRPSQRANMSRATRTATPNAPNKSSSPFELARATLKEASNSDQQARRDAALADIQRTYTRKDLEQQASRRWRPGDVYAPHDLSGVEMSKWKKVHRKPRPGRGGRDVMDSLGMNPINEYKNFSIMSEYVSEMGRIRHGNDTGLRPVNQRRMAKAIRRAIGLGLMPSVYRHPEILRNEIEARGMSYY